MLRSSIIALSLASIVSGLVNSWLSAAPLHYQLFAKYVLRDTSEVNSLPNKLHQQISDACHTANGIQASSYNPSLSSEELNYSLGNFRCKRIGDKWEVFDIYKFDSIGDSAEGGPVARWIVTYIKGSNYTIKTTIPIIPITEKPKSFTRTGIEHKCDSCTWDEF